MGTAGCTNGNLIKPQSINLSLYPLWLDKNGYYCVESDLRALLYVCKGTEIGILTASNGYVRLKTMDIPKICEELMGIYEDEVDRKRMGLEIKIE